MPKRIHMGALMEVSADVFSIRGMSEDCLTRIGCHPIRTEEQRWVRREGPRSRKGRLRSRGIHQLTHFDFDWRSPPKMYNHPILIWNHLLGGAPTRFNILYGRCFPLLQQ